MSWPWQGPRSRHLRCSNPLDSQALTEVRGACSLVCCTGRGALAWRILSAVQGHPSHVHVGGPSASCHERTSAPPTLFNQLPRPDRGADPTAPCTGVVHRCMQGTILVQMFRAAQSMGERARRRTCGTPCPASMGMWQRPDVGITHIQFEVRSPIRPHRRRCCPHE